jgi:Putative S-adenosyl-L-methionine-dependent methyltransferase
MLARRHVAKLLADYYAQPANSVVGSVLLTEGDINFKALWGEFHYRRKVASLYAKQEGRWLTSVELMRPYYSKSIGNFVAEQAKGEGKDQDFDIVEVGGGRATNASIILTQLQQVHPHIYDRVNSYTMIDASPSLLDLQRDTMRNTQHFDKMKFELKDMIDVAEKREPFLTSNDTPTIFITCELLDNLPHDKVRIKGGGKLVDQAEIIRSKEGGGSLQEVFVPLSDPLLSQVLKLAPEYTQDIQAWIPTVACGVLHRLRQDRPNTTLMLADFDCKLLVRMAGLYYVLMTPNPLSHEMLRFGL